MITEKLEILLPSDAIDGFDDRQYFYDHFLNGFEILSVKYFRRVDAILEADRIWILPEFDECF
jgi:hypothetical protein